MPHGFSNGFAWDSLCGQQAYARMPQVVKAAKPLNMNIDPDLLDPVQKYRFKKMFATRSEAIEFLLEAALKVNPERPKDQKPAVSKGE